MLLNVFILDKDIFIGGKKDGNKKRNTLIKFVPLVPTETFSRKTEWIYLLVMNNRIVKIGGTRTGLKGRVDSYLCGHHIEERGKSGDCSSPLKILNGTLCVPNKIFSRGNPVSVLTDGRLRRPILNLQWYKTNGFIYNTFEFYLNLGCKIQMYAYELPKTEITVEVFGKETKFTAQTFHVFETAFLEDYKKKYNEYPILSDNCYPEYRTTSV